MMTLDRLHVLSDLLRAVQQNKSVVLYESFDMAAGEARRICRHDGSMARTHDDIETLAIEIRTMGVDIRVPIVDVGNVQFL